MKAAEAEADGPTSEPPSTEIVAERSAKRARQGPLLFGAELIQHDGTQDELVEAAPQGAEANQAIAVPSETPAKPAAAPASAARGRRVRVRGGRGGAAVLVVLVRANAPVHPRFTCTFCAMPPTEAAGHGVDGACFFATVPVRSSALADGDGVAPEKGLYFAVPGEMLCEGGGRELVVSVRIDRSCGPEPPSEDYKMILKSEN